MFREILEDLVERTPGAIAAVFADWEGEAVGAYTSGEETDYDIKVVGAHHGILLDRTRQVLKGMDLGQAKEITFQMDKFHVLTAPVNGEYYVVLTIHARNNPGQAKHALRQAVVKIREEIGD